MTQLSPTSSNSMLEEVIAMWIQLLGSEGVIVDKDRLQQASRATFATQNKPRAILYPTNRDEVIESVRIANKYNVTLHPISTGKNWGYGSKVPSVDGAVLMNLSRMNRILDYDPILGVVTLEPGVTQQQLYDFLQGNNGSFWMDVTGSSPDTSLIGNVLQRGYGMTSYGDRWKHLISLEAVKWDGTIVKTGMAAVEGAHAAKVHRYGVGPCLEGLFSQSSYGIVTQMTIELMPAPEHFEAFFFSFTKERLPEIIDTLRPLRMHGIMPSAVHIGNEFKALSALRQYPWEITEETPLPEWVINQFKRDWGFSDWNGSGGLYGTKRQINECKRMIKRCLAGKVSQIRFVSSPQLAIAKRLGDIIGFILRVNVTELMTVVEPVFDMMRGKPSETQLKTVYWRKRSEFPDTPDLDADGVGLFWCSPIAPLLGSHAVAINKIIRDVTREHQLEPIIAFTLLSGRLLSTTVGITYDRQVEGADELAADCYQKLSTTLLKAGYPAYRLGLLEKFPNC